MGWIAILLFLVVTIVLFSGYPVALVLAGVSLWFALLGSLTNTFDPAFLAALPNRIHGIMLNQTLIAVPLFILMGVTLERCKIAEDLLNSLSDLLKSAPGGLSIAVLLVGVLMAASTGIVGATVVTMGLISLPTMLRERYDASLSCGVICAAGTLGQIIPPSIVLVLLGDVLSSAYQQAQLTQGVFSPKTVSVGDLFIGALLPGLLLVGLYLLYLLLVARRQGHAAEPTIAALNPTTWWKLLKALVPPLLLMLAVLGSIITGIATPTEAAAVGAVGALCLAILQGQLSFNILKDILRNSTRITCMIFFILLGAALFSLVFRGFGGDELIHAGLMQLPGGKVAAILVVMLLIFLLGFVLDFIEITFIIIPIVGPVLLMMDIHPVWLGIMIAVNLQTSFLTPPFGFALFYLRGVAPKSIDTLTIYRGVIPFIIMQLLTLLLLSLWPNLATMLL